MIFTPRFIAISSINFLVMTAYYLLFVISSPYAQEFFKVSPSISGLVAGMMLIGCLAGRFVTGRYLATLGFKKVLFTGIFIYTASLGLYLGVSDLSLLLLVRFLSGIGVGCTGTATGTLIVHIIPAHQHGLGINIFSMSTVIALALGPFLGIFLMQAIGYTNIFLICTLLGIISFFVACFLSYPEIPIPEEETGSRGFRMQDFVDYAVVPIALVVFLVSMCYGSVQAFLSFYAKEIDLLNTASFFFLVYAVTAFIMRPFLGDLFDRKGPNIVIYPTLLFAACGLLLLSQVNAPATLLFTGFLMGAGIGNFQTAAQAISMKLVSKHRFAQATSTYYIFLDLGIGIGPFLLGKLVPFIGYRGLYLTSAAITFACLPLYFFVHGRKK